MIARFAPTWSTLRYVAGMTILSVVFVVSQGLVLAHELVQDAADAAEVR